MENVDPPASFTEQLAQIRRELRRIKRKLIDFKPFYTGGELNASLITDNPKLWQELVSIDCTFNPRSRERDFAVAWNEVNSRTKHLMIREFGELAWQIINLIGYDHFPSDIPDPPQIRREEGCYDPTTAIRVLTGTNDIVVAGLRVIYWCAASLNPKALRRVRSFPKLVELWVTQLVEFGGRWCGAYFEPLDWADAALKYLAVSVGQGGAQKVQVNTTPTLTTVVTPASTEKRPAELPATTPHELKLSVRQKCIMQAVKELTIKAEKSLWNAVEISKLAEGGGVDPERLKTPLAELVKKGLLNSKRGCQGGYWLTKDGQSFDESK